MGHHRAERSGRRRPSSGPRTPSRREPYAGKRVAGRADAVEPAEAVLESAPLPVAPELTLLAELDTPTQETPAVRAAADGPLASVVTTGTHYFDLDATAELPLTSAAGGKRKAVKHAGRRGPLIKGLPSPPALVGRGRAGARRRWLAHRHRAQPGRRRRPDRARGVRARRRQRHRPGRQPCAATGAP